MFHSTHLFHMCRINEYRLQSCFFRFILEIRNCHIVIQMLERGCLADTVSMSESYLFNGWI